MDSPGNQMIIKHEIIDIESSDSSNEDPAEEPSTILAFTNLLPRENRDEQTSTVTQSTMVDEYDIHDICRQLPESTVNTSTDSRNQIQDQYGFTLKHPREDNKASKSCSWTYSSVTDELYVKMNADCPLLFKIKGSPPAGSYIRTMPVYTRPEDSNEYPKRCLNHSAEDHETNRGHTEPEYLVRSFHTGTLYTKDKTTGRMSTILPYLPPDLGSNLSAYVVRFMCRSSCAGGMNRRPMALVFSLEHNGKCLGRQTRKVKVCACPGRDRQTEEARWERLRTSSLAEDVKRACKRISTSLNSNNEVEAKQRKIYTITVNSKLHYNILSAMVPILQMNLSQEESSEEDG